MDSKLHISVSPHIHTNRTTSGIMLDVLIALAPATIAAVVFFGLSALWLIIACVATSVLSEALFYLILKKEMPIGDLSAAVTGLLLALNLSANIPIWQGVLGSVFAIIIVKCFFGGIGCNVVNPAITGRVFMLIAFGTMAKSAFPLDSVSTATPLVAIAEGNAPKLIDLFIGNVGGCIGETSKLALLLGFVYLLVRRVISWHTPVVYIATVFAMSLAICGDFMTALAYTLSGGLFIGAIFMATDYVTSPSTPWGKVIFALGAGVITVLIRFYGNYPEGVSFAILLMNILNPFIEKWTRRKVFGGIDNE
ncbi:MAG: RnfABCDGE type electron transport complex subunit D [Clostridia bacterium]|nr:RnfABCDGE type electron transport complex subunit D [Clostridia bacterium]